MAEQAELLQGWSQRGDSVPVSHSLRPRNEHEAGRCLRLRNRAELELFHHYYVADVVQRRQSPYVYNELKRYDDDDFAFRFFLDFDLPMPESDELELYALQYAMTQLAAFVATLFDPQPPHLDWILTSGNRVGDNTTLVSKRKGVHARYFGLHCVFPQVMVCLRDQDGYLFNSVYYWMQQWWRADIVNSGDSHTDHLLTRLADSLDFTNGLAMIAPAHHMPVLATVDGELMLGDAFHQNPDLLHRCLLRRTDEWQVMLFEQQQMRKSLQQWQRERGYHCHERALRMCTADGPSDVNFVNCQLDSDTMELITHELRQRYSLGDRFAVLRVKKSDTSYMFQTNSRRCTNVERDHRSNHVYFVATRMGVSQRCLDPECAWWRGAVHSLSCSLTHRLFAALDEDSEQQPEQPPVPEKPQRERQWKHSRFYYNFGK